MTKKISKYATLDGDEKSAMFGGYLLQYLYYIKD